MPDSAPSADTEPHSPADTTRPFSAATPRRFGAVNWLGLRTLYVKEVRRFMKVFVQTLLAPAVTTLLFMVVFTLAWGDARGEVMGQSFAMFLAPGLVMMSVLANGFANSSSSLIVSKIQGNLVDILMPPLSDAELAAGFIAGAATRGVVVGVVGLLVIAPIAGLTWPAHWGATLYFLVAAATMMGALGVLAGVWAEKFDHLAAVTNFVITPLSFLSGTFYSISILPEPLEVISRWNPFFHAIDGFRYGFLGASDANPVISGVVLAGVNGVLIVAVLAMLRSGWRLKA